MLTLFEDITSDLNEFERNTVVPAIVSAFHSKANNGEVGQSHAVTGSIICKAITAKLGKQGFDYVLNAVKLRKVIGYIRQTAQIARLCSSSHGYYIAENQAEMNACIESLEQRIRQQQRVIDALKLQ